MQYDYFSDSLTGPSAHPLMHPSNPTPLGFSITPQDIEILQQYLTGFQIADASNRSKLVEQVMGDLYKLRPVVALSPNTCLT